MMKIDSLLNNGPAVERSPFFTEPPPACLASAAPSHPRQPSINNANIDPLMNTTTHIRSAPASPENILSYSPYQHPPSSFRECTVSSRSSYSGPSVSTSTAATTPPEIPMHPSSLSNNPPCVDMQLHGATAPGSQIPTKEPPRPLPPFGSLVNAIPPSGPPLLSDSAISPRSTGFPHHHQREQHGLEIGYFPPNVSGAMPTSYYQTHNATQFYPQNSYTPPDRRFSGPNDSTSLMDFAEVAMETRRNHELEAAAEALTRRRRSSTERHEVSRRDNPSEANASMPAARMLAGALVDPSLKDFRDSEAPGTRSTAPNYREGAMSQTANMLQQRPATTQMSVNPSQDADLPLFRPTPEPSTPQPPILDVDNVIGPVIATPPSPHEFLGQPPKCSYCNVCTTGSPLRKVVSHIFGRNKLSTRQIPKNVWVYYCRKHYQRSRYRNPRGFARQQVLLVRRQCERLAVWGGVRDWVIKVRRREELRMNREGDNGEEVEEVEEDNEEVIGADDELDEPEMISGECSRRDSMVTVRRRSSAGAGGSNWIMRHTGVEKTIDDIYKLLDEIEIEVQQNGGKFPDVELLPNVDLSLAVTLEGSDAPAAGPRRNSSGGRTGQGSGPQNGGSGPPKERKRKRDDSAGGGSAGNNGGKGTKKARTPAKKSDLKGKGKAQADSEGPRTPGTDSDYEISPQIGEARDRSCGSVSSTGTLPEGQPQAQIMTPSPSGSSTARRNSQEFAQPYTPPRPRRSSRVASYPPIQSDTDRLHRYSPPIDAFSPNELTPKQLAAIAGEPLHRFDLRRHRDHGRSIGREADVLDYVAVALT